VLTAPDPGMPKHETGVAQLISSLAFRFLVAIDIEGFSRRSAAGQAVLQENLEYAMSEAAASAGLDRELWYRQPRGDGEFAMLPADADGLALVADYPRRLESVLAEINRSADQGSRLRVRVAIHHGAVYPGPFGPVGSGPITVCRLVDAKVLRQTLVQRNELDVALIVSAAVYDEIVQSRLSELDPQMFRRASVRIKDRDYVGYLYSADQWKSQLRLGPVAIAPTRPRWHYPLRFRAKAITITSCGS
jgi:class 3 adenylate cyclase